MIQKDYIMRMVEQLAKALAKVLFNKNAGHYEEALETIETASVSALGLDFNLLDTLSGEAVAELLGISKDPPTGSIKCLAAGRLLKEKMEIQRYGGSGDFSLNYRKVLRLYLLGMLNIGYTELDLKSYYADIMQVADRLRNSLPDDLMLQMFKLHCSLDEYDKAEEWLFRLREHDYPGITTIGMEFFKKLKSIDAPRLQACHMTEEEIDKALADFINDQ